MCDFLPVSHYESKLNPKKEMQQRSSSVLATDRDLRLAF
jgi:hypothetical protein